MLRISLTASQMLWYILLAPPLSVLSGAAKCAVAIAAAALSERNGESFHQGVISLITQPILSRPVVRKPGTSLEVWAHRVASISRSEADPTTIAEWARMVNVSRGALRSCCYAAGIGPRVALDVARLVRAVTLAEDSGWPAEAFLNVSDTRTIRALLRRSGLNTLDGLSLLQFFAAQQLLQARSPHIQVLLHWMQMSPPVS